MNCAYHVKPPEFSIGALAHGDRPIIPNWLSLMANVWAAVVLLVMRHLVAYRHWNCSCNWQLTQLDGNISYVFDAMIDNLQVLVWWIHLNLLWLTWLLTHPLGSWHLESTWNHLCYHQSQLDGQFMLLCICNAKISSPYNCSFIRVLTHLGTIRHRNSHEIICYHSPHLNRHIKSLCWCNQCCQICMVCCT